MKRSSTHRRIPARRLLLAAAFLCLPLVAGAQSMTFGSLSGRVVDAAGAGVGEAEVRIEDRASGSERYVMTDRDGRFVFGLLPAARYDVHAEALGFRPVVHLGVGVDAGNTVIVELRLRAQAPPVTTIDSVAARGSARLPLSWLAERGYADLGGGRRLASDFASIAPMADADGVEGLPWRRVEAVIDGARSASVLAPSSSGRETAGIALPSRGLSEARVGGVGYDVEMSGTGVGIVANSARGGSGGEMRSTLEGGTAGLGGALAAHGALQRDTAHAIIGVDYQRSEVVVPAWFPADDAEALAFAAAADASHATDLGRYTRETPRTEERAGGFARFDWLQGDRFALSFRASATRLVLADPPLDGHSWAGLGARQEATAGQVGLNLLARLSRRLSAEVRVSGDIGEYTSRAPTLPVTTFASRNLTIGGGVADPFTDSRTTPRVSGILHTDLGAHRVKVGVSVASSVLESQSTEASAGSFRFGDAADFAAGSGAWRQVSPPSAVGSFRMSETAFFVQDSWRASEALSVQAGLRLERQRLPLDRAESDGAWVAASGLAPASFDQPGMMLSPRVSFRWELGDSREWVVEGGAGTFRDLPDRRDIGELLAMGGGADVRYGVGALGGWPDAPAASAAPDAGRTLTLVGPEFEGPRTRRLSLAVQRSVGPWTGHVAAVYRHTDFLSTRRDLNLSAAPAGTDQYGRPLLGTVRQVGSLLAAQPGANRRFAGFDAVSALEVRGASDYRGITIGIDRAVDRGISLAASYTFSRAHDNTPGTSIASLDPFPGGLSGDDWAEGRSSLDVPHRALVAAEWSPAADGAVRIGALLRARSAAPFTARFRDGVDANADGDGGNDPAFIDASLPGMGALLEEWDCLREDAGGFATRNGCRGEWRYRLDLRASLRLFTLTVGDVSLVLDAMDALAQMSGRVDDALLLVDRTGTLATDPGTGVTTVPLVVNPDFGKVMADRSPGMVWRVGVRIGR